MFIKIKKQPVTPDSTTRMKLVVSVEDGDKSMMLAQIEPQPYQPLACKLSNILGDKIGATMIFVNHQ